MKPGRRAALLEVIRLAEATQEARSARDRLAAATLARRHAALPCTRKLAYQSQAHAERVRARSPAGDEIESYCCAICGRWHLGHPPRRLARTG